jgi:hypothetical protein
MYVRVSSVFVLPGVRSGLATGLITRPRSRTNCLSDPQFQINSDWKQVRGPNTKGGTIIIRRFWPEALRQFKAEPEKRVKQKEEEKCEGPD